MDPEKKIKEFVDRARQTAEANLECIILYGSAATGEYDHEFSDLNIFCVLRDVSFSALQSFAPVAKWWAKQHQPAPLVMSRAELERSADVFTIELLDMQHHHRLLYGNDVLQGLHVPMNLHRVQVEYELREKLVLLRKELVLASDKDKSLWELLLRSVPSFVTLFRHAALALGQPEPSGKRGSVEALSKLVDFDVSAVLEVLDVREHRTDRGKVKVAGLAQRYLAAIEQVTAAVDKAMESGTLGRS
ncbi:MAG TPA: hypothetical protein VN577_06430 [Terriglobales bacterium]|nr:hypothetical protein [Terriglobales bacterium]